MPRELISRLSRWRLLAFAMLYRLAGAWRRSGSGRSCPRACPESAFPPCRRPACSASRTASQGLKPAVFLLTGLVHLSAPALQLKPLICEFGYADFMSSIFAYSSLRRLLFLKLFPAGCWYFQGTQWFAACNRVSKISCLSCSIWEMERDIALFPRPAMNGCPQLRQPVLSPPPAVKLLAFDFLHFLSKPGKFRLKALDFALQCGKQAAGVLNAGVGGPPAAFNVSPSFQWLQAKPVLGNG